MTFFYSDSTGAKSDINVWKMNGTRNYLKHFDQFLFLDFVAKNGTSKEKWQAEKEIVICKRKLAFWQRHPRYDADEAQRAKEIMIKNWRQDSGKISAP